jgi:hypothetical protein
VDEAFRFLEMVRRELGAHDVRIELGLRPPPAMLVSVPIGSHGAHVVVHFDGTATTDTAAVREKLTELVASFSATADDAVVELAAVRPPGPHRPVGPALALTEALETLAHLAKAELALVIDDASPEIWGASDPALTHVSSDEALLTARLDARFFELDLSLPALVGHPDRAREALDAAGVSPHDRDNLLRQLRVVEDLETHVPAGRWLRVAHAIAGARGLGGAHLGLSEVRAHVRAFAGIYRAILVYEGPFSELHAEGALVRALPVIEKLVTSLPPRDPASGGAKVAVLRRLRRV